MPRRALNDGLQNEGIFVVSTRAVTSGADRTTRRVRVATVSLAALAVGFLGATASPAHAGLAYITNFTKTANIYDNLNQEFPHSGTGTPGNPSGAPNASYLYTPWTYTSPDFISGSDLVGDNGVTFDITSDSSGHDYSEIPGGNTLTVSVGLNGVTSLYALQAAYYGPSENITVTGADGYQQTFSNIGLPDFNGGAGSGGINNCSGSACAQTALLVLNTGGGGTGNSTSGAYNYYDLTEVSLTLDSHLASESINSMTFAANSNTPLLLGVTAQGASITAAAVPEPATLTLLGSGLLGLLAMTRRPRKRTRGA